MADKTIGDLPKASALYDNDRMVLEQNGEAKHMEGRLLKDYVEPYATAAQSALEGVREAIDNIPEGVATPIVNDLTTGGASMALSAEMGKVLKNEVDAITPESIGAIAWDNRSSLVGVDILEWALEQKNPTTIGVGSDVTNMPTNGTWWTVELNIAGNSSWRTLIAWQATAANIVKYERRYINGTWGVWKQIATTDYAVPLDGSKPMTGALNIRPTNTAVGVTIDPNASALTASLLRFNNNGNVWGMLGFKSANAPMLRTADGTKDYNILHTGNKPSGSYTGNGSAAERTIDIGGMGSMLIICSVNSIALVNQWGGVVFHFASKNTVFYVQGVVNYQNGTLTLNTAEVGLNGSGYAHTYYSP